MFLLIVYIFLSHLNQELENEYQKPGTIDICCHLQIKYFKARRGLRQGP